MKNKSDSRIKSSRKFKTALSKMRYKRLTMHTLDFLTGCVLPRNNKVAIERATKWKKGDKFKPLSNEGNTFGIGTVCEVVLNRGGIIYFKTVYCNEELSLNANKNKTNKNKQRGGMNGQN
jgi:hypothetical protein